MLYLTHDTWHRYLPCYIWHMIPDTGTWHAILIIWYLTPVLVMLYLLLNILSGGISTLTWHRDPWLDTTTPDTCIIWDLILWHLYHIAYSWLLLLQRLDYYIVTRYLVLLNSYTPEPLTPVLLNSYIPEPLKEGGSWCYTPDTILLLIPIVA